MTTYEGQQQQVFAMLRQLSGQGGMVVVPRLLINYFDGKLDWAAMLSQLLYWSDKNLDAEGWFVKPDKELIKEVGISQGSAFGCRKWLKDEGLLLVKTARYNGTPMLHYKIGDDQMAMIVARLFEFVEKGTPAPLPKAKSDPYFEGVAEACDLRPLDDDWSQLTSEERGQLNRSAGSLRKAKKDPALIPGFRSWWNDYDWRGQKGQAPKPMDLPGNWLPYERWLASGKAAPAPDRSPASRTAPSFVSAPVKANVGLAAGLAAAQRLQGKGPR
jgi:hypothetical protein